MAITITVYNTNKRHNSTAIPQGGMPLSASLKENTSVINPVFTISVNSFPYNMLSAFIAGVKRYYYIDNVISIGNKLWEVHCSCDVLASWKEQILATRAYVLYSTNGYSPALPDMRIPVNYTQTTTATTAKIFDGKYAANGSYMLSCVGEGGNGVNTFMLRPWQFVSLMANIANYQENWDIIWPEDPELTVEGVLEWLGRMFQVMGDAVITTMKQMNSFGNAIANIRACTWIPFVPDAGDSAEIVLGGYHTGVSAPIVQAYAQYELKATTIPWQFSDWRNEARHTDVYMYLPWVGTFGLPTSQIQGFNDVTIWSSLSPLTGDIAYNVVVGQSIIASYGASTGCSVPVGASNINPVNAINALASGAAGIVANPVGGAFDFVMGASAALTPVGSTVGGIGNSAAGGLNNLAHIYVCSHGTPEAPTASAALHGCPTFKTMSIPTSGFVQTQNFEVIANCLDSERQAIASLMDSGVYIE